MHGPRELAQARREQRLLFARMVDRRDLTHEFRHLIHQRRQPLGEICGLFAAIDFRRPEVRRYFTENALYWLHEYRFDGLRFDAVHAISEAGWLDEMAAEVRRSVEPGRHVHLVLEHDGNVADHLRRDTSRSDWAIAYNTLGDILKMDAAETGKNLPPQQSKVWRKIVRLSGTVESVTPPTGNKAAWVNDIKVKNGKQAVLLRSAEGFTAMLYIDPRTAALQPSGKLAQGKVYTVIARADWISGNTQHTQSLDVLSYAITE